MIEAIGVAKATEKDYLNECFDSILIALRHFTSTQTLTVATQSPKKTKPVLFYSAPAFHYNKPQQTEVWINANWMKNLLEDVTATSNSFKTEKEKLRRKSERWLRLSIHAEYNHLAVFAVFAVSTMIHPTLYLQLCSVCNSAHAEGSWCCPKSSCCVLCLCFRART